MRDGLTIAGMPDANPDALIVIADMRRHGFQPIMSRMPAAEFDPHLTGLQVDLVMEDDHIGWRDFVEANSLAGGAPGFVHVGCWL